MQTASLSGGIYLRSVVSARWPAGRPARLTDAPLAGCCDDTVTGVVAAAAVETLQTARRRQVSRLLLFRLARLSYILRARTYLMISVRARPIFAAVRRAPTARRGRRCERPARPIQWTICRPLRRAERMEECNTCRTPTRRLLPAGRPAPGRSLAEIHAAPAAPRALQAARAQLEQVCSLTARGRPGRLTWRRVP